MKSLQHKLIVLLMMLSLIPLVVTNWNNLRNSNALLESQIRSQLSQVARVKQAALDNELNSVIKNAEGLAGTRVIQSFLDRYQEPKNQGVAYTASMKDALDVLWSYQESHWGIFHHVFITDTKGQVILSPPHGNSTASHLGQDISDSPFFQSALSSTQITDFFGFEETDHYHQLLLHPIKNSQGETLGVIVFEVFIDHIKAILTDRFELGDTGRIFLMSLEGVEVVNKKADHSDPHFNQGIQTARDQGLAFGEYKNKQGEDVLGFYLRETQYPWIMAVEISQEEAYEVINGQFHTFVVTLLLVSGVLIFLGVFFGRKFTKPLIDMSLVADKIAEGDVTQRVAYQGEDEMGTLARALNRMASNLGEILGRLSGNAANLNITAVELSDVASDVTQNISDMSDKSSAVAASAGEMSANMGTVSEIAELSATNVNTVASGTEEMTSTVAEIAQNAETALQVTSNAVQGVAKASEQVSELGTSADEITKVIEVIVEIAEQTKLLALNATIEAARAGEAGKGFAVVASEVKDLAQQTNDATEEIRSRIEGMQRSTQSTVTEIQVMNKIINEVNERVVTIAAAVEEQSVTTQDIAQNVSQASAGIQDMSINVTQAADFSQSIANEMVVVDRSSSDVEAAIDQVTQRAEILSKMGTELKEVVDRFKL